MRARTFVVISVILLGFSLVSSCFIKHDSDVLITYSISFGGDLDVIKVDWKKVDDAFREAFNASGLEPFGEDHWVMRSQTSSDKAEKIAKSIGDKADASLNGFRSSLEILSVNVSIDCDFCNRVVASYDYTAK